MPENHASASLSKIYDGISMIPGYRSWGEESQMKVDVRPACNAIFVRFSTFRWTPDAPEKYCDRYGVYVGDMI